MLELTGQPGAQGCLSDWAAIQALTDLKAEDNLLDAVTLRLFTACPTPNSAQTLGDCTEASFGGYTAITPLVFATSAWEDGYASVVSLDPPPVFTATGTTPQTVVGYGLTKVVSGSPKLIYLEKFATPKPMTRAGHQVVVPATLNLKVAA